MTPTAAVVLANLAAFAAASFLEIAGCFAFWAYLRQGRSLGIAAIGVVSLIAFAVMLTKVDAPFAGRAYAAYGGIYIASSLVWLWLVEGQTPSRTDFAGAALAIVGAIVIILSVSRR